MIEGANLICDLYRYNAIIVEHLNKSLGTMSQEKEEKMLLRSKEMKFLGEKNLLEEYGLNMKLRKLKCS